MIGGSSRHGCPVALLSILQDRFESSYCPGAGLCYLADGGKDCWKSAPGIAWKTSESTTV